MPTPLVVSDVSKSFTMHLRDGVDVLMAASALASSQRECGSS